MISKIYKNNSTTWLIFLVYLLFSVILLQYHELWRDELHSWNIAYHSNSFVQLFQNIKLEGHPIAWYSVLYIFKTLGFSYLALPYINLFFAALSVFLFLFYSPFNFIQKLLFPFGVIFGYEYSIIARNYAICIPLFFIFCILYPQSQKRLIRVLMVILLFLAMNTSIFASFTAIGIFCVFWGKIIENKVELNEKIVLVIILFLGICLSFYPIYLTYFHIHRHQQTPEPRKLLVLFKYLKMLWFSKLFLSVFITSICIALSTIFSRKKLTSYYYLAGLIIGALLISSFWALVGATAMRHFGFLFILLVVVYWLYLTNNESFESNYFKYFSLFFTFILIIQVPFYFKNTYLEITKKFSNNFEVKEFIKKNQLENSVFIGNRKYLVESFGTMFQKQFYSFDDTTSIDFVRWETHLGLKFFDQNNLLKICKNQEKDALLIMELNPVYTDSLLKNNKTLKFLGTFDGAFRSDENYNLFYYKRPK
jgi:hypothetical protein